MNMLWTAAARPRGKWIVLALWIVAAAALGTLQPRLQSSTENDPVTFLPEGADSRAVLERVEERFPSGRTVPALVVWQREGGLTEDDREAIRSQVGILLDTFVVRTLLVPAVALLLGDRSWWPRLQGVASFEAR